MAGRWDWFAIRVKPRSEVRAVGELAERGFETFCPSRRVLRRWSDRRVLAEEPLFPGYFFCRFDVASERLRVLQSPGVISVVGIGNSPIPVADSEIAAVRKLTASDATVSPWPYVRTGQSVRIERGPLSGLEGIVVRCDTGAARVVVSVNLLQRSIAAEIERDWLN